ncbi:MAG: aminotransferase class IV [Staphylococcaceae bacterium]|nr:aminotransferase class IV [Staphylococcaceae bacterium]MBW4842483.1 aminotransferase class IV [Staphylococcaceae bacterium]
MQLFETMKLEDGCIYREVYHLKRITESSKELKFNFDQQQWYELTQMIKTTYPNGKYRLKLTLEQNGQLNYVLAPLANKTFFTAKIVQRSHLVKESIIVNKTSERHYLEHSHETDLILLYDENGKILEFDIGNIMIEEGNEWYTPCYNDDFLRGCMRQSLIDQGKLKTKNIDIDDFRKKLQRKQINVYLINSLREVADVKIYL